MSLILIWGKPNLPYPWPLLTVVGANKPVVRIGRIAGQFAK